MHRFPKDTFINIPERFTDPFRYTPHPLVTKAADLLLETLESWACMPEGSIEKAFENSLAEGKMLGVLVVIAPDGEVGFLCGFSGNAGGRSIMNGFVPPIFDLLDPDGDFKKGEAELNLLNQKIRLAENSHELTALKTSLYQAKCKKDRELNEMKAAMADSKANRDKIRSISKSSKEIEALIKESQHEKANLRRLKNLWEEKIKTIELEIASRTELIHELRKERASKSDELQKWIFDRFVVSNAYGQKASIKNIFAEKGLTPPGGTGECAAPKMLNHAYTMGLKPVAMGEFWYGKPSATAVRVHGHFYPSCTSKCGPLLKFMLKGVDICSNYISDIEEPRILFEDDYLIVVEKPSGIPSVPGLDGRGSLLERLGEGVKSVHRLDMDTSGVMIYAKDDRTASILQKQFEEHIVRKAYKARLSSPVISRFCKQKSILTTGVTGNISLPLSPDYDERPRQKVDHSQGKTALTRYEVTSHNEDGTTDIIFYPETGRTHQLRVHSAHPDGLNRPIVGDLLYGGATAPRLCLHAQSITFRHPMSEMEMTFSSDSLCYR